MSFHGGFWGCALAMYVLSKQNKRSIFDYSDPVTLSLPFGIMLGRMANFMNGELLGRPTDLPWGITFLPGDGVLRHPSQVYESIFEGLLLLISLNILFFCCKRFRRKGMITSTFMIMYGVVRIILENFREPDAQLGYFFFNTTMGQLMSVPLIIVGIYLLVPRFKSFS